LIDILHIDLLTEQFSLKQIKIKENRYLFFINIILIKVIAIIDHLLIQHKTHLFQYYLISITCQIYRQGLIRIKESKVKKNVKHPI
jgi:hypothetical protein